MVLAPVNLERMALFSQFLNWPTRVEHLSRAGLSEVGWARPWRFQQATGGGGQTLWHMSAQQGSPSQRAANSRGAADLSSSLGLIHYSSPTQIPSGSNVRIKYAANESNALSIPPWLGSLFPSLSADSGAGVRGVVLGRPEAVTA